MVVGTSCHLLCAESMAKPVFILIDVPSKLICPPG